MQGTFPLYRMLGAEVRSKLSHYRAELKQAEIAQRQNKLKSGLVAIRAKRRQGELDMADFQREMMRRPV